MNNIIQIDLTHANGKNYVAFWRAESDYARVYELNSYKRENRINNMLMKHAARLKICYTHYYNGLNVEFTVKEI